MKIGLLTAMQKEMLPLLASLGEKKNTIAVGGLQISEYAIFDKRVFVTTSGIGEIQAALATQLLCLHCGVDAVLNLGLVGNLSRRFSRGEVVFVSKLAHHQFDVSALDGTPRGEYCERGSVFFEADGELLTRADEITGGILKRAVLVSGDEFVADGAKKQRLIDDFGGEICDMEGAGIAVACEKANIPWLMLKCVSDDADGCACEAYEQSVRSGGYNYALYLSRLLELL